MTSVAQTLPAARDERERRVNDAILKAIPGYTVTAKGDLLVATGSGTVSNQAVGANNALLVADSSQATGVRWASTLAGLTLTSPAINGGTLDSASTLGGVSGTTLATVPPSAWQPISYGANVNSYNTQNSVTNFYDPGCRTENGCVRLKGLLATTGNIPAGNTIATLPVGYRPPKEWLSVGLNSIIAQNVARIDIFPSGIIALPVTAMVAGNYISLDGITFPLTN